MDGADEDADADAGGTEIEISSDPYDSTELCAMRVPGAAGAAPRAGEGMLPVCVTLRCVLLAHFFPSSICRNQY